MRKILGKETKELNSANNMTLTRPSGYFLATRLFFDTLAFI